MMTKEQILQKCTVEGTTIKLPPEQLERKLYQDVAKALELIGGRWKGNKVMGFVFATDPTDLLEKIANGEKRNLKKEYQFFATPEKLADKLVELAEIKEHDLVLEPSAGQGAIIKSILKKHPEQLVHAYEAMSINRTFLEKIDGCILLGEDFLDCDLLFPKKGAPKWASNYHRDLTFNRIIANPPFSKNQDIDHVKAMYQRLRKGGRIVCITSESWVDGTQKKQVAFNDWLNEVKAKIIDVEKGAFKESGTMVGGKIVIIDKSL